MASASGGVDWAAVIKPILAASYGSYNKSEVLELIKAINKSEIEFMQHDDEYDAFYTSFAALAADYISSSIHSICKTQIGNACQASKILLEFLLKKLKSQNNKEVSSQPICLSPKQLLLQIKALCTAKGMLEASDHVTITMVMKNAKVPSHVKASSTGEKEPGVINDMKRSRTDLSYMLTMQLTSPLYEFPFLKSYPVKNDININKNSDNSINVESVSGKEIEKSFVQRNISHLQSMMAGDVLIDICLDLPQLSKYINKYREATVTGKFCLPSTHAEAILVKHNVQALVSDTMLVWCALSLPVFEPLHPARLEKICDITMACLYCSACVATASSVLGILSTSLGKNSATASALNVSNTNISKGNTNEEEGLDTLAVSIVEKSLEIFNLISDTIKNSTRAGGNVLQNHKLLGVWVLLSGLQVQISSSTYTTTEKIKEEKGKSPIKVREGSSRVNLMKVQQNFGVLSVALASLCLTLMSDLLDDLQVEANTRDVNSSKQDSNLQVPDIVLADLTIHGKFTALQRAAKFLNYTSLNQLLFYLATISYRKACTLKRIQKYPPEGDTFSTAFSDSTTYYEDDLMSCSEPSSPEGEDEDEESDRILGLWFEETLAPPESLTNNTQGNQPNEENPDNSSKIATRVGSIVPEKGEPHGFISLATQIFQFMNKHLLNNKSTYLWQYVQNGLSEQQMIILAAIIRDLDRETARTETGTISVYFGAALGNLYCEFSQALSRFTHNLLVCGILSDSLQNTLLNHLGVCPWASESMMTWPLQVYPRTLAVLAQVLLLKSNQQDKERACINIWHRLINDLADNVCSPPASFDVETEDLNVEHAQLLLFFFHSLNLMQKKSVLLMTASAVIRCSESIKNPMKDSQLLHLSRLLLLLEYLMKHLYDAPPSLLEQVQWNLFNSMSAPSDSSESKDTVRAPSRIYCPWKEIEDNYRKFGPQDEFILNPRFYSLTVVEVNNQDQPKLDGLACNFILGTPDKLKYPQLIDSLIQILNITSHCHGKEKLSFTGLCAVQYCFTICWRLLLILPPSTPYMDELVKDQELPPNSLMLHSLVWGPRSGYKTFTGWMRDCLVRQGMYTHNAEKLLMNVAKVVNSLEYDIKLAKNCIKALKPKVQSSALVMPSELPNLADLCLLDAVIAKVQVLMDESICKPPDAIDSMKTVEQSPSIPELAQNLLPYIIDLTSAILACCRTSLLYEINVLSEFNKKNGQQDLLVLAEVLCMSSRKNTKTGSLGNLLLSQVPVSGKTVADKWNSNPLSEFPWNTYANDLIPAESYILVVVNTHISSLSGQGSFSINPSLQHLLYSLVTFIGKHISKCPEGSEIRQRSVDVLVPLTMESCSEYLYDVAQRTLEKIIGDSETEAHQQKLYYEVLKHTYALILIYMKSSDTINDKYLQKCLKFIEGFIDTAPGRQALDKFFNVDKAGDLVKVLLSISTPSKQYVSKVLKFLNKLLAAAEKKPGDNCLDRLCESLTRLVSVDEQTLQVWLRHLILGSPSTNTVPVLSASNQSSATVGQTPTATTNETKNIQPEPTKTEPTEEEKTVKFPPDMESTNESPSKDQNNLHENHLLLQNLTNYITKDANSTNEELAIILLKSIIPISTQTLMSLEGVGFSELMSVMSKLADVGSGKGHVHLFKAAIEWLQISKQFLTQKEVLEKIEVGAAIGRHRTMLDSTCHLLNYVSEIVTALGPATVGRATSPPWDNDAPLDLDCDWMDDVGHDDDESGGEDSDEDSLCNKLCTFTISQKEFMNQHWYHCHTCKMVEGVGVCTVCARVCHRGHDITYAKYGNFFCDCGAKQDGSCQALTKRTPQTNNEHSGQALSSSSSHTTGNFEQMLPSSLRRRASSPVAMDRFERTSKDKTKLVALAKQLEHCREVLTAAAVNTTVSTSLLQLLKSLVPAVKASCDRHSPIGCHLRGQIAMNQLHNLEKKFQETDQLMLPTLGSQEGAFENVRMNYSGDQGQMIKQLLSAHMIRRVAMCCLSSPHGKRQHLAVSHEKGKITVLQLSALLKQTDSSKRKLSLTRLASAPIPFTVLSITGNPWNEDFLAVCGLKDCHVVTFSSNGLVADHLVLHPQLEGGNYIIKAIWLPGSQTELALVTADFIKIYDLSKDAISPKYFFLVPAGKYEYNYILVMSSAGHIYSQEMYEESLAIHGPFFVMDVLEIYHPEVKEFNGQVESGGVSIYYSHALQMLFFSYSSGKSFVGPLAQIDCGFKGLPSVNMISLGKPTTSGNKTNNTQPQPLCQWSEVPNHPGLVFSVMQTNNNPVILMIKLSTILVQEIKVVPAKAKIIDMVAIRHPFSNADHRTTLILLCEDGSLRIYMASMEQTGFWLSPSVQAAFATSNPKQARKKKAAITQTGKPAGNVSFPIDFFEHCQAMNDVEFGGDDLLQVYNAQQIRHRLNTIGTYVVSTKQSGFNVEITNSDHALVITGVRVSLGNQDASRSPAYIEIFGRSIHTTAARNRWFDFPLTREESLQADKKLTITFGPSPDPDSVIIVDSIKVYGKTKDAFGWPEETEDLSNNPSAPSASTANPGSDADSLAVIPAPLTSLEKMVSGILEVLDGCFTLTGSNTDETKNQQKSLAIEVATVLLTLPTPTSVQHHTKSLLSALHTSKAAYHNYKDFALLNHAYLTLQKFKALGKPTDIDPEAFYRLVLTIRSVAVARPNNLIKFAENLPIVEITSPTKPSTNSENDDSSAMSPPVTPTVTVVGTSAGKGIKQTSKHFMSELMDVLWQLLECSPKNMARAPVCKPGLTHIEAVVQALVEIFHAFTCCGLAATINEASKQYTDLLLSNNLQISFSAKLALIRVLRPRPKRRRVFIPSPPNCSTPGGTTEAESNKGPVSQPSQDSSEAEPHFEVDTVEPMVLLAPEEGAGAGAGAVVSMNPIEALLGGPGGFSPLLDADDETMVELAIALSLQDHEGRSDLHVLQQGIIQQGLQGLDNLQGLQNIAGATLQSLQALTGGQESTPGQGQEAGHYSDTTASAGGSDDEGSTAATDGSTLRTSPAEQGGSAGSESGGSGVESITGEHNVSGRSSAYGDNLQETLVGTRSETSSLGATTGFQLHETDGLDQEHEPDTENSSSLHELRLTLLQNFVGRYTTLKHDDGVHVIPFMQVILMLTSDLDGDEEKDKICLEALLSTLIKTLEIKELDVTDIWQRTTKREVHLVVMRLLSVLMSRSKTNSKSGSENSNFVSQTTATVLLQAGVIKYCLKILQELLKYWKISNSEDTNSNVGGALLKPHLTSSPPDMSPFFLRQYVKGHANDVFDIYPQLLTEMALRLPYQIQKHVDGSSPITTNFDKSWFYYLCEYMMTHQTPFVRRQVRKLLLFLCGNKDKYRQLRDLHALESHMQAVQQSCRGGGFDTAEPNFHVSFNYDSLVELIEHLKACVEVATYRTANWQSFCLKNDETLLFLFDISCILDDGVSPIILQLLQCALCCSKIEKSSSGKEVKNTSSTLSSRKDRDKSDDSETDSKLEEAQSILLVQQINKFVSRELLSKFVKAFLLETNATNVRWQAHALILALYQNSSSHEQDALLNLLWKLWPQLPAFGRKGAQFVDLLGYFSLKASQSGKKLAEYIEQAVSLLQKQNELLSHHPNASLYDSLTQFVEFDGYYLESEPCLVCNNPEVSLSNIKLSSIKIDSKFTTTTQFVKLVGSHTISKITLRIGDLKRTKMVRTINIYYNNKSVQAVVELKNKFTVWHKAKKVSLISGQTEVKIEFPLPIIACNLMIEYADFYENIQATSETLQCPRCSASVPANPGVCGNCGENVFQCHKCRAINYDEKDPFLCHSCGFCKYAKFDYTLTAKPCCAVDPIENDEDRNKSVAAINSSLEKADRVYRTLISNKPTLELLILKIAEHRLDKSSEDNTGVLSGNAGTTTAVTGGNAHVNKAIQLLAQKYCGECKSSFEELSKIIQKVLACRRELVTYDRNQKDKGGKNRANSAVSKSTVNSSGLVTSSATIMSSSLSFMSSGSSSFAVGRCYGCASAATEHCLTLLRALASNVTSRQILCSQGLVQELVKNNLRKGTVQIQELLCLLTRDNAKATQELCTLLMERIALTLVGHTANGDLAFAVRHDMALLAALVQKEDNCWEQKLRCVMQLLILASKNVKSPVVMESITLPCLKILQNIIKPSQPTSKKNKEKTMDALATVKPMQGINVSVQKWLQGDPRHAFKAWRSRMPAKTTGENFKNVKKEDVHAYYLMEKYGNRWRQKQKLVKDLCPVILWNDAPWLKKVLFNPSSRMSRQVACNMLESLCQVSIRKKEILDLLTGYLGELGCAGESAAEFLSFYQNLLQQVPWKLYLAVKGLLLQLADLLTKEIQELHRLEETTLTSDLAQGYSLKMLTELLASLLEHEGVKQLYKGRLVGAVLNGYLSLRRLVVQRTEEETKAFMAVCIETVKATPAEDIRTPVFVFERLCSIIYPEESDTGEFYLTLEKDPQQEDFLQGRMLGNPYSSNEHGLGPLMRDVKNKICQDCELVALLEDDNGMELLVNNKIISLNLPVREVYKKVWLAESGDTDTMRVVYRMRGLLGDATEEFVETLNAKSEQEVDNEEVYKMANVMADCGGLQIMLDRLSGITDLTRARPLLQVLLKLFRLCVKVKRNQEVLAQPELNAISVFLNSLKELCSLKESNAPQSAITEELLDIMEIILSKATSERTEKFYEFSQTFGGVEHIEALLGYVNSKGSTASASVLQHLMRVIASLTYGNEERMAPLIQNFAPVLDFNAFDFEHTPEDKQKLELFCILTSGIDRNVIGNTLKDYIISLGIVKRALEYITSHAPPVKTTLSRTDSFDWKEFISKPSLKYILRFLAGLATDHDSTQLAVSVDCIPIIHRLEQVSSDEHVGSLAENLLEALKSHPKVASRIEEVREQTRAEKKRLAMAMRERQLGALGMKTNEKGQVTADSTIMQQVADLGEETGHVCVICREGYKFQPTKVLGIYTFTKRCNVEEYEVKTRKTVGYSTVTHFNVVHVDCHMAAVRLARARDEWESAALQNANTKCNGLLPLWGPQVPESAFASCLARHNTYLQECTGHRDINYASTVHDLKLLLLRFAQEKSFHDDTGGGGPQSNMYIIPYLLHMALYVINTTRSGPREDKTLTTYLEISANDKWLESSYEAEGPFYMAALSLLLCSPARWEKTRLCHLRRLLVAAQARHVSPSAQVQRLSDVTVKDYSVYKSSLVYFALINGIYTKFFKKVVVSSEQQWPNRLADYIRHNDEAMIKASDRLLACYREEFLPCTSFEEFCDVVGLLGDIPDSNTYIFDLLRGLS
ncbi:hypothetical protein RUM43_010649 [Polyplax serrata]|uniref:UBR-type domain-containing protein n=1 Tax=Polyplax serrata TaxID=468196 RepID=A0AAN8Q546_POLSC